MDSKIIHKFDNLWVKAILPAIEQCSEEADDELKIQLNLHTNNLEYLKNKIEKTYLKIREQFKMYRHFETKDAILDLTKLASVICFALIKHKIFIYEQNEDIFNGQNTEFTEKELVDTLLINYKLAFYAALNITYISLVNECVTGKAYSNCKFYTADKKDELLEILKQRQSLKMYTYGNEKYDGYVNSTIKNLAFLDQNKFDFDFMGFAITLENLKEYNKIVFFSTLLKN